MLEATEQSSCVGPRFTMDPNNLQIGIPRTRGNRRLTRVTKQISRYFDVKMCFFLSNTVDG